MLALIVLLFYSYKTEKGNKIYNFYVILNLKLFSNDYDNHVSKLDVYRDEKKKKDIYCIYDQNMSITNYLPSYQRAFKFFLQVV